jgi:hypothetical protein
MAERQLTVVFGRYWLRTVPVRGSAECDSSLMDFILFLIVLFFFVSGRNVSSSYYS